MTELECIGSALWAMAVTVALGLFAGWVLLKVMARAQRRVELARPDATRLLRADACDALRWKLERADAVLAYAVGDAPEFGTKRGPEELQ